MIKKSVNASDDDVVIFTGSGTTGAIHKLIGVLELRETAGNTVGVASIGTYNLFSLCGGERKIVASHRKHECL